MIEFAQGYFDDFKNWIQGWYGELDVRSLLTGVVGAIVASIFFDLLVRLLSRLAAHFEAKIQRSDRIQAVRFRQQEILSSTDITRIVTDAPGDFTTRSFWFSFTFISTLFSACSR